MDIFAKLAEKIMLLNKKLSLSTIRTTIQNLLNFPVFYIGKMMYDIVLGKIFLAIAQKIGLTGKIIYKQEKACAKLKFYPAKYPNALVIVLGA